MIRKYPTFLIGGDWAFPFNTNSLGLLYYRSIEGVSWALVMGLWLKDIIKGRALVLGLLFNLLLSLSFGLVFWACAPIILNPIKSNEGLHEKAYKRLCISYMIDRSRRFLSLSLIFSLSLFLYFPSQ